jgi:hypothetical protein
MALVGNLWAVINPGRALRGGDASRTSAAAAPLPGGLGVWPAVALFLAFA